MPSLLSVDAATPASLMVKRVSLEEVGFKEPLRIEGARIRGRMPIVLGFDVYGTLVDPFGMERQLEALFGDRGSAICALWRQKQLEYSFRRGLMRCYENFDTCTEQALSFAAKTYKVELPEAARRQLLTDYLSLPAFPDVPACAEDPEGVGLQAGGFLERRRKHPTDAAGQSGLASVFRSGGQRGGYQNVQAESRRVCLSCPPWRLFPRGHLARLFQSFRRYRSQSCASESGMGQAKS